MPVVAALPDRLLLGAGPSPVPDRVLTALGHPPVGHLDPVFGAIQDDVAAMLREVFGTANRVTFPLSATGSGGMQAMVDTLVAPGDRVVVGVCGAFGARMAEALRRAGAEVVLVEAQWGRSIATERLVEAIAGGDTRAAFVVHAETSTGVLQPLGALAEAVRARDGLLLVDCVTSLGGVPVDLDAHGVDAAFSGTQKCLNVPPGLAPFSVGERALGRVQHRSWYFDLQAMIDYWFADGPRAYHHTAPINMVYSLHEGLRVLLEEGLKTRYARHIRAHSALRSALAVLGFDRVASDDDALPSLLAVTVPEAIDESALRGALLAQDGIEVSGGLGPLAGRVWRIGVMGLGAEPEPQERLVRAIARRIPPSDEAAAVRALQEGWTR